jgi:glycosyltransferase involved in cell wall biosynthesis
VTHVLVPARVGGLESVVALLADAQRRAGIDARVITLEADPNAPHPFAQRLAASGVPLTRLPLLGRAYLRERAIVRNALSRERPDVVHTHGYRADVVSGSAALSLGLPVVTTMHGFIVNDLKDRLYQWVQRRVVRRFGAVIAVSRPLIDVLALAGVPRSRIRLIPNGYAPAAPPLGRAAARDALGVPRDGARIGWVGRLGHEKGCDVMLEALALLPDVNASLSVLGDGAERARLEQQAQRLGVTERVTWHGAVPGAAPLYPAFDLFALSSRTEGTPIALLEAMSAGVTVVATRVGGVPDVLGDAGLLVPAEDPAALAVAIRHALTDRNASASLAERARLRVAREHGLAPWVARHAELYDSLVPTAAP